MYNTDLPTRAQLPSTGRLVRSTLAAAIAAAVLLAAFVMPAEYGIDPTGIGAALGLKQMGEIKLALAREAAQEKPPAATPASAAATQADAGAAPAAPAAAASDVKPAQTVTTTAPSTPVQEASPAAAVATHETRVTLKPGQAAEIKLHMRKGARVRFAWTTTGGPVNFDNHGDPFNAPKGFYHGYGKGRQVERDAGEIEAAFDGRHGFFWRNRGTGEVTVVLKTEGEYSAIKRVL